MPNAHVVSPEPSLKEEPSFFQEALLYDIPMHIDAEQKSMQQCLEEQEALFIQYVLTLPREMIVSFYKQEMERFGWKLKHALMGTEYLLVYEKPKRVVIVSIRSMHKNKNLVVVMIRN